MTPRPARRPRRVARLLAAAALCGALGAGCGPRLVVRHEDPGTLSVRVVVDGAASRTLRYGRSTTFRLRPGYHHVLVYDGVRGDTPWAGEAEGIPFVLERRAILTLLPEAVGPGSVPGGGGHGPP